MLGLVFSLISFMFTLILMFMKLLVSVTRMLAAALTRALTKSRSGRQRRHR
jgi:hypothetical protein